LKENNPEQVRSSVARRLGIEIAGAVPAERNVEGVVEMLLDATQRYDEPLSDDRLFGWHALFQLDEVECIKIKTAAWRRCNTGNLDQKRNDSFEAPGPC
jgi:hypothetical protein